VGRRWVPLDYSEVASDECYGAGEYEDEQQHGEEPVPTGLQHGADQESSHENAETTCSDDPYCF
jgi:hypothetical protein